MGLIKKLLFGPILGGDRPPQMPSYLRNAESTYTRRSNIVHWRCIFCGKLVQNSGLKRPSPTFGGKCNCSPYGTHRYEED